MDPTILLILIILLLFLLLAGGLYIAFALLLAGVTGLYILYGDFGPALACLGMTTYSFLDSVLLVVIPLFILLGHFAFFGGVTSGLYDFAYKWVGRLHGGLAMASVMACAGFAAVTGSSAATAATVGKIALPEMRRYGYDVKLATGTIASAGTLGNLIPPSTLLVVYGFVTGESIGALLIAGIIPGIVSAAVYMVMIYIRCRINPSLATLAPPVSWKERFVSVRRVWGMLIIFFTIMGSIYLGIATATEAAAVGTLMALLFPLAMRRLGWSDFRGALLDAGKVTGMVFAICMGSAVLNAFFTSLDVIQQAPGFIAGLHLPKILVLACILLLYVPLGMFLEPVAMMLITLPIVHPIITHLGINGIFLGVLVVKLSEIAMITPPVGINVYVTAALAHDVTLEDVFRGCGWFFLMDIVTVAILVLFPQITLWLPSKMWSTPL